MKEGICLSRPILYPGAETAFADNGLGVLPDAVSCIVAEERNGMYELEMQYPVSGLHYADIALRSLILAKPNPTDGPQPFRVYRITKPLAGVVTVYAQHISYDLAGIPTGPFTAANAPAAMAALGDNAAVPCPFVFWTDKDTAAAMQVKAPASIRSLLGGVRGSLLDAYGGEYAFDRYTVRLYAARGADRGVAIRYGKNLTSLEQDESCAAVYTGAYPYWADSDGNNLITLPEKIVPAPGRYDFTRILTLDFSGEWQEPPTAEQLRARAGRYIAENKVGVPKVSLEVQFAPLEQSAEYAQLAPLERVSLCDSVTVQFDKLGVNAAAKVVRTSYNVLLDRYDSIELGDARANIADTIVQQQQAIAEKPSAGVMQSAINSATAQISGNLGGYVALHSSTGGRQPDEILIMDTPDIATAAKVWRWNKAGLGYSKRGYNGPYGLAMTADGAIVADFITTGTLNAAEIKVVNLIAEGVKLLGNFRTTSGSLFADLWAGVFKMGQNNGTQDNEFVGLSTSASDPDNGMGIINIWKWANGEGNVATTIYGENITTQGLFVQDVSAQTIHCNSFHPSNESGSNCRWVWSGTLGGYVLSTSTELK